MALKMILSSLDGVSEEIAAHYTKKGDKFELQAEGAKSQADIDRLQNALNAERAQRTEWETKAKAWGDLVPDEVRSVLDRVPELEATVESGKKKLDQSQLEPLVAGRVAPVQRALDKALADLKERDTKLADFSAKETKRTVFDAVRKLASETNAIKETYSSDFGGLMLLAKEVFTVDAQGQVVVKEGVEGFVHGTRISDAWPDIQRTQTPYWPSSVGGGAGGNTGTGGNTNSNVFKSNDMTARSTYVKEHGLDKANAAAKAAGLRTLHDMHPIK